MDTNLYISPFDGEAFKKMHINHLRKYGYERVEDFLKDYPNDTNWGFKSEKSMFIASDKKQIDFFYDDNNILDLKKTLQEALKIKKPRYFSEKLLGPDLFLLLENSTRFLKNNPSISERMYYVVNDIHDLLICEECNERFQPRFRDFEKTKEKFLMQMCSVSCSGVKSNRSRCKASEDQIDHCCLLYGDISEWSQAKIIHASENYENKITCANPTCKTVPNYHNGKFQEYCSCGCNANNRKILGADNFFSTVEGKQKTKDGLLMKYGVEYYNHSEEYKETCRRNRDNAVKKIFDRRYDIGLTILEYDEKKEFPVKWKCNRCNHEFGCKWKQFGVYPLCPVCGKNDTAIELKIIDYLTDKKIPFEKHVWGVLPKGELDFLINWKNEKYAIECHGIYYHLEKMIGKEKHLIKYQECQKMNIKLFQIFEDEINYKWDLVKSKLNNIFGLNTVKYDARKCIIRSVSFEDTSLFLNDNHLQGTSTASIRYGLYYNDILVSLMTFGLPRLGVGKKNHDYELIRFCNKKNCSVRGSASKLFKFFLKSHGKDNKILSYSDNRWSANGNLYLMLGFKYERDTEKNFWYVKGNKRYHRFTYAKQFLNKKLKNFDETKTADQNLIDHGYNKIWDAGSKIFIYN